MTGRREQESSVVVPGPGTLVGARTALLLADAVTPAVAATARQAFADAGWQRYRFIDRGSYEFVDAPPVAGLLTAMVALASQQTGRALQLQAARALRLVAGDYTLAHHDTFHEAMPIELTLDLSTQPVADAGVHYRRRGHVFFVMPSQPGAVALVERGPAVTCSHAYVSKRWLAADVQRLVLLLR